MRSEDKLLRELRLETAKRLFVLHLSFVVFFASVVFVIFNRLFTTSEINSN